MSIFALSVLIFAILALYCRVDERNTKFIFVLIATFLLVLKTNVAFCMPSSIEEAASAILEIAKQQPDLAKQIKVCKTEILKALCKEVGVNQQFIDTNDHILPTVIEQALHKSVQWGDGLGEELFQQLLETGKTRLEGLVKK